MASTGTALWPGSSTFPNTNVFPGQGERPYLWCLYSTDSVTDTDPLWVDATALVRGFQVSRGRENELGQVDAGTATITLDNRQRDFDPIDTPAIRPGNRWWLREQFASETQDIFIGYAESYDQLWSPGGTKDAVAVVTCSDEMARLARERLPVMSPPRDSYADVVMSDGPTAFWQFPAGQELEATVGPGLVMENGHSSATSLVGGSAITGEEMSGWLTLTATDQVSTPFFDDNPGQPGNPAGLAEFTIEFWLMVDDAAPAGGDVLISGHLTAATLAWRVYLNANGTVGFDVRNSTPTLHTVTSAAITANVWHHVVATIESSNVRLYVNGAQAAATAWTGSVLGPHDAGSKMTLGDSGGVIEDEYDEVAYYPFGLTAARVAAHHQAGTQRGYVGGQMPGVRAAAILDTVASPALRRLDAGERQMPGRFMRGQSALDELRDCANAEAPDGVLFVSRSGEVVILDNDHRSSSPYNTVQATFDDDGTDLPYMELDLDYSDAFLINEWNITGAGTPHFFASAHALDTSTDAASVAAYGKRPQSASYPVILATDLGTIGDALIAKTKDPFVRVLSIGFKTSDPDLTEAIFRRDIGDRIRVFRRPPGGGTAIDRTVFIQKVDVQGDPSGIWTVRWAVSPL